MGCDIHLNYEVKTSTGWGVRKVSAEYMQGIVAGNIDIDPELSYYTTVLWEETYRDAIGESWFATLDHLKSEFGVDNVRLVFWFDN